VPESGGKRRGGSEEDGHGLGVVALIIFPGSSNNVSIFGWLSFYFGPIISSKLVDNG